MLPHSIRVKADVEICVTDLAAHSNKKAVMSRSSTVRFSACIQQLGGGLVVDGDMLLTLIGDDLPCVRLGVDGDLLRRNDGLVGSTQAFKLDAFAVCFITTPSFCSRNTPHPRTSDATQLVTTLVQQDAALYHE